MRQYSDGMESPFHAIWPLYLEVKIFRFVYFSHILYYSA